MAKAARMTSSAFGFCPECSLGCAVPCQKSMREQDGSLAAGLQAAIRVSLLAEAGAAGRGYFWPMVRRSEGGWILGKQLFRVLGCIVNAGFVL